MTKRAQAMSVAGAKWRSKPEVKAYLAAYHLRRKYNLSVDDFQALSDSQGGACGICSSVEPLCVDHDHETDEVRGLLCGRCNRGLGFLGDNLEGLALAADYLGTSDAMAFLFKEVTQ